MRSCARVMLSTLRQSRPGTLSCFHSGRFTSVRPLSGIQSCNAPHQLSHWLRSGKKEETSTERAKRRRESGAKNDSGSGRGPQNSWTWLAGISTGLVMGLSYNYTRNLSNSDEKKKVTGEELLKHHLAVGHVEKIEITDKIFCEVHCVSEDSTKHQFHFIIGNPKSFEAKLDQLQTALGVASLDHVPVQHVKSVRVVIPITGIIFGIGGMILILYLGRGMLPKTGGGGGARSMFNMGSAEVKDVRSTVRFNDVAGLAQAKQEVVEFVEFLKDPTKYEKLGARLPKGGLLVGPPGTGKTLLAKAVAGEANVPFYSMSGSDFVEMYGGVGPSRVRDLFKKARSTAPSIIFIDEIDAVGRKRSNGARGGNDERENTLNQLLVEMDGFASATGVVVLAGTNRADILDQALTRPGRFDRQIPIDKPDLSERREIFSVHLGKVHLAEGLSIQSVANRMSTLTPGFAGSDIANICNEAAISAARRSAEAVEMPDFERATDRVIAGLPKQNGLMSPETRRSVALHECGHAVAGWFLEHADPLLKVSIVPRSSGALGFAQYLPDEIRLVTQQALLDKIAVSLGGRAAEEIFVGRISTGAADDLDKVTKMAYSMVTTYGMNPELGLLSFNKSDNQFYKPFSEETGQLIDNAVRQVVNEQYNRVKDLLTAKRSVLTSLSEQLLAKETLVYTELKDVLGERPFAMTDQHKEFLQSGTA
mmetsp:Transcript_39746/g.105251  ORF Transcript_39746/g.105251 Transcript_39746/m.105251 type:complete len:706 (-) Transcript_39746:478-2595(-)